MTLESFANELLLDLFEYIPTGDLLRAFYDLNSRFADLIVVHFQSYAVNFQSISKNDFDLVCRTCFPVIADRISSLRLSDDDDTPQQIDLFFAYGLTLRQFSRLKTLSIHRFHSSNSIRTIIEQLVDLPHLRRLKITRHHLTFNDVFDIDLIPRIALLTKLTSCHLDITNAKMDDFLSLSMTSSSITYLSLPYFICDISRFIALIRNLPRLTSLLLPVHDISTLPYSPSVRFLSITGFDSIFFGTWTRLSSLLQTMPNLRKLKIDVESSYIDGHQWQSMIESYLPRLSKLQFKMSVSTVGSKVNEDVIDSIVNSFQSPFWITVHRWFVQCQWTPDRVSPQILVYTLPYAFRDALFMDCNHFKTTAPADNQDSSFDSIHNLYHSCLPHTPSSAPTVRLKNVRHFDVSIPWDPCCPLVFSSDRLISLTVYTSNDMNAEDVRSNLQLLLDRSPRIHSLTFRLWSNGAKCPVDINHQGIRQLYLKGPGTAYNHAQCAELSRSSLGQQCEVLQITVTNRTDIVDLVIKMSKLRALIVQCTEMTSAQSEKHSLVEWLGQHLPKTCAISLSEETNSDVRIWIR